MKLTSREQEEFRKAVEELLDHTEVQKLRGFYQHGGVSRLDHSMSVAAVSYIWSRRLHLSVDSRSLVRGALLHDFFLYDWREKEKDGRKGMHGFTHPKSALENADRCFELNRKERDIILRHMWPLTVIPPRCKEAAIVCLADKYCATAELLFRWMAPMPEKEEGGAA